MYANLKKEMQLRHIDCSDLAVLLCKPTKTIEQKIAREITLYFLEAESIRDTFFPELDLDYLFAISCDAKEREKTHEDS
jgi:hypothetical protein